jgi:hypothetical protein
MRKKPGAVVGRRGRRQKGCAAAEKKMGRIGSQQCCNASPLVTSGNLAGRHLFRVLRHSRVCIFAVAAASAQPILTSHFVLAHSDSNKIGRLVPQLKRRGEPKCAHVQGSRFQARADASNRAD